MNESEGERGREEELHIFFQCHKNKKNIHRTEEDKSMIFQKSLWVLPNSKIIDGRLLREHGMQSYQKTISN